MINLKRSQGVRDNEVLHSGVLALVGVLGVYCEELGTHWNAAVNGTLVTKFVEFGGIVVHV